MRDDEIDGMTAEEFKRKWEGSLTEIKAQSKIKESFSGGNASRLKHPEDKGIKSAPWIPIPGKNELEKEGFKKQQERAKSYLFDAIDVRRLEVLDPNEMPITKLFDLALKTMPQKVEGEVEHRFSYGEMILKASKNLEKVDFAEEAKLIEDKEEPSDN
jgi:hypothetical protein